MLYNALSEVPGDISLDLRELRSALWMRDLSALFGDVISMRWNTVVNTRVKALILPFVYYHRDKMDMSEVMSSVFVSDENNGSPMASPGQRSASVRKSLAALDANTVLASPEKVKADTAVKTAPRSIKKMLSTPVKAIRNLLPSVPSGWYSSASASSRSSASSSSSSSSAGSSSSSGVSMLDRVKELKNSGTKQSERENEKEKEEVFVAIDDVDTDTFHTNTEKENENEKAQETVAAKPVGRSGRRVSMGLSMKGLYDEEMHLPKYSQAEMDTAMHKASKAEVKAGAGVELKAAVKVLEMEKTQLQEEAKQARQEAAQTVAAQAAVTKELSEAQAALGDIVEDAGLQKVQSKALTHRLAALEMEYVALQAKCDAGAAASAAAVAAAAGSASAANEIALAEEQARSEAALKASADEADRRVSGLRSALEDVKKDADARQAKHARDMSAAVKDAKARVYEKAKQQFEAGNKEFKTVRAQLKDACAEKDVQKTEMEGLTEKTAEAVRAQESAVIKTAAVEGHLMTLLDALGMGVTDTRDVSAAVTAATAQHVQSASALASAEHKVSSYRLRVPDLEARCSAAESSAAALEAKIALSHETLRASEALLEEAKKEAQEGQKDSEAQMMAVAKLSTANAKLEAAVEAKTTEVGELTTRCANLRTMNEEVMDMLEKGA